MLEIQESLREFLEALPQKPAEVVVVLSTQTMELFEKRHADIVVESAFGSRDAAGIPL